MNILILDDDKSFIEKLHLDFHQYFQDIDNLEFVLKSDHFNDLNFNKLDIAFIDIDLVNYNGIEIAKKLHIQFPHLITIFISSREEFVFQTLTTNVFQFIRKAKYKEDLEIVFEQLKNHISHHFDKKILKVNGRKIALEINKINYILSIGHDIIIKENEHEYTIKSSISEILNYFHSRNLVQIQRNLVINLQYVKEVKKTYIITKDNHEYKIGRIYQKDFLNQYEEYLLS